MIGKHPVESLLRPVPELSTACVALASSVLLALCPGMLMMVPDVANACAVILFFYAMYWLKRGRYIARYQKNLRKAPRFKLAMKDVPISSHCLYLGRGFDWQECHTQRLHDTRRSKFQSFVAHSALYRFVRKNEVRVEGSFLYRILRSESRFNPVKPLPSTGGNTVLHGVELKEVDVQIPLEDRNGHMLVVGTTGVGKTRLLELMVAQDIRRGDITIVIDPKGDADLLARVKVEAERTGRGEDLVIFHLGYPEISARYNAIGSFSRITEIATRLSGQLSAEGNSAVFREFAWRFTHVISRALIAMGKRPDFRAIQSGITDFDGLFESYVQHIYGYDADFTSAVSLRESRLKERDIPRHLQGRRRHVIAIELVVAERGLKDDVLSSLRSLLKYERNYFDKIIASLLPLLEKLSTGSTADLLSPDYDDENDPRDIFDWRTVVNQKSIVYIGLDALSDPAVSAAVGNSMFADLVSFAGQRYKYGDTPRGLEVKCADSLPIVRLHCDEFNELMGDEFIPMINKGRGAGLQITAYTQALADIMARISSQAKAMQVVANFNSLIMMRVKDRETAALLTEQLPSVEVVNLTVIAGYNETSDIEASTSFASRYEDRITSTQATMIEPHDVMKLPKGQAFMLLQGGGLKKLRFPMLTKKEDVFETPFQQMLDEMRRGYQSSYNWWEAGR